MSDKIRINFQWLDNRIYTEMVDPSITVERMLVNFLERVKSDFFFNQYSFMVNATPLDKIKFLKMQVKNVGQLRPDCYVKVRLISRIIGG